MDMNNPKVRALSRETSLAAQTCCTGLTALREASSEKTGVYYEAFFNLATGIERLCKIVIILDYTLDRSSRGEISTYR